jgi:hypothetical protein
MIRKLAIVIFALLATAFFLRLIQSGHHWVAHSRSPEHNYKALTIWSAFFMAVCAAFALGIAQFTSPDDRPAAE